MTKAEKLDVIEQRLAQLRANVAGWREELQVRLERAGPQRPEDHETQARYRGELFNLEKTTTEERKGNEVL